MTLPNNKVKLAFTAVDYKPFISLFNVTNATVTNPEISGIGEKTVSESSAVCSCNLNLTQLTMLLLLHSSCPRIVQAIMRLL